MSVFSVVLSQNLNRQLQKLIHQPARKISEKRSQLWSFERLDTIRRTIIQRAGRLTHPSGKAKLTMNANQTMQDELLHIQSALKRARRATGKVCLHSAKIACRWKLPRIS